MYKTKRNTIFTNSKNSRISDPHRLLLSITDKIDLKRKYKYIALSNLSIYYTWKNIKKSYKNNRFKLSALTWSEELELVEGSCSISDIQDYYEYILGKQGEKTVNPAVRILPYLVGSLCVNPPDYKSSPLFLVLS